MMRQMRENTKIIMLITALAFAALMVFEWGMDASGRSSAQLAGGQIGSIDGEPVTYEAYGALYRSLYDQQSAQQDAPITPVQNRQIEDAAWDQLVNEWLVRQEITRRGLSATPQEIRDAARFSPPPEFASNELFQTDGQFDLQKYHQFLASPAVNEQLLLQLEQYYREAIPRAKLFRQVIAGVYVTDAELWRMWRDRRETVRVEYVALDPRSLIPDAAVSVTEEEVRAYYEQHIDELERPARAAIRFVALRKAPEPSDSSRVFTEARRLRQQIVAGERTFADAAAELSADEATARQGGDLGPLTRGQGIAPPFENAVFSLPIGEISEPVLTRFGYHLIQVENREGDQATVRHILLPIERDEASENLMLERADSLEQIGETRGLAAAAEALGLEVRDYSLVQGTPFIPAIGSAVEAEDWAFTLAESGMTSPLFENETFFYMVELEDVTPAGTMSFEETRTALRGRVLEQKKLERTRAMAREVIDRVRAGATLGAEAERLNVPHQTTEPFARVDFVPGLGSANAAIGTAFGLDEGAIGGPAEVDGRVYVIRLLERTPADREGWQAQLEQQRQRTVAALEQSRIALFLDELRDRAEIVDLRDQALAATPATATL
ncbi:MAG: SurA N-terminal domain-containing protein [Longimicrobiales bacterium]